MNDAFIREQLVCFLKGQEAHMSFEDAVKGFPMEHINDVFPNGDYTFWHLLEHIRRTQHATLDFLISTQYQEPEWPKDYWPEKDKMASVAEWEKTIEGFEIDLKALIALAKDSHIDLYAKVPNGTGQIFLREFMLAFDHNTYHIGEFAIMRQVLKLWPE